MREITYIEALNETIFDAMKEDERVFVIGQGCTSPWYVGGLTLGLLDTFGSSRVIDTPVSENAMTGAAVGAAIAGLRPILIFPRMDFMLYAMDPIINHAAKWHYMFGGAMSVPLVIIAIINRGGSQGCQHSQDFTWMFKQVPGLKVARPSNPWEGKGMLTWAINEPNPVVFVDNRELYHLKDEVDRESFGVEPVQYHHQFGKMGPFCPVPSSHALEEAYFGRGYER